MSSKADQSKAKILAAALVVMDRLGARALTLDKVALEAGVSKGGLTHHFKSKHDLFLGLVDHVIASMEGKLQECLSQEPEGTPGRFTRAYMRANLDCIQSGEAESMRGLVEMLLAEPRLVLDRRDHLRHIHGQIERDGLPATEAMALAAASDGCWMNVILGFYEPNDPQIAAVHEHLFALSRPKDAK